MHGLGTSFTVRVKTTQAAGDMELPDAVLVAVKAHDLASIAQPLGTLAKRGATIVTMQNGVPFWFFENFGGRLAGRHLQSVDPEGNIAKAIDISAIVCCVVSAGARIPQPGMVERMGNAAYALGEPTGEPTERLEQLRAALASAGLEVTTDSDIRAAVWHKLIGNVAVNPVSTLARATAAQMADDPGIADLLREIMREQIAVGRALGFSRADDVEARIQRTRTYGDQHTSMLQDFEAGRPLELDPIVGAAVEIAGMLGVPVPVTRHVYALTKVLARGMAAQRREG